MTQPPYSNVPSSDPSNQVWDRTAPPWREEYQPHRKYLNASNWFFLALKVFGYSVLGYFFIAVIVFGVLFVIGLLLNAAS